MGDKSAIEWTDASWNCLVGCSRVSAGCVHCYAERTAYRAAAMGTKQYAGITRKVGGEVRWTGEVRFVESALDLPLRWKKPRRVFVNSMSDLFHEKVKDEWIAAIFAVMLLAGQHTYQILTKRPERMRNWMQWLMRQPDQAGVLLDALGDLGIDAQIGQAALGPWPKPHIWLGTSVEDQATADERIPLLLETPAAVRWVSYEPALGPVDFHLGRWVRLPRTVRSDIPFNALWATPGIYRADSNPHGALSVRSTGGTLLGIKPNEFERLPDLDWIVCGGESGYGARPFDLAWARATIEMGRAAGTPIFVKQIGTKPWWDGIGSPPPDHVFLSPGVELNGKVGWALECLRDRKGGALEDWPSDLRIRDYPV